MVSTRNHLYFHYLYQRYDVDSITHIVGRYFDRSHTVCVTIRSQVISSARVRHRYWDIYGYISFTCTHTR